MSQNKVSPADPGPPEIIAEEKFPADMRGKKRDGGSRLRHQKKRKPKSRSQSPSKSSRLFVVPETSHESKLVAAEECAKEPAGEGLRSIATNETEAKETVVATKSGGSQAGEDGPTDQGPPKMIAQEKLPALTDMRGKNRDGGSRERHQKKRKPKSRSQSPSKSSRLPVVPESSHESKLLAAEESAKEPAGEGLRSIATNEAEAKETAAAAKSGGSQAGEDGPKRKVSLCVPEADRQRIAIETPSQSSRYNEVPSRPSLVEVPPDDPRGEMFLLLPPPGAAARDLKSDSLGRWRFSATDYALVAFAVTCSLAVLWALLFGRVSPRLPQLHIKGLAALEHMPGLCNSTDCEDAVREVVGTADPYVDPCGNLEVFACGRWCTFANRTWAATYWREQRRRYVSDVEATVMLIYRRARFTGQPFHYMASFYASCLGLLGNRKASIVDCWDAAGVALEQWSNASDFTTLFALAIHTIVRSGVPSVFNISTYNDVTVEVNTGMAIATTEADDRFRQGQCLLKSRKDT